MTTPESQYFYCKALHDVIIRFYGRILNEYNTRCKTKIKVVSNLSTLSADNFDVNDLKFEFIDETDYVHATYDINIFQTDLKNTISAQASLFEVLTISIFYKNI
jgi:hypothetical protein